MKTIKHLRRNLKSFDNAAIILTLNGFNSATSSWRQPHPRVLLNHMWLGEQCKHMRLEIVRNGNVAAGRCTHGIVPTVTSPFWHSSVVFKQYHTKLCNSWRLCPQLPLTAETVISYFSLAKGWLDGWCLTAASAQTDYLAPLEVITSYTDSYLSYTAI